MFQKIISIIFISTLISKSLFAEATPNDYLEIRQIYNEQNTFAVSSSSIIKSAESVSILIDGKICNLSIDSKKNDIIFLKMNECLPTDKIKVGTRLGISLLQKEDQVSKKPNKEKIEKFGLIDFKVPEEKTVLSANIENGTTEYVYKVLNTKVIEASQKGSLFSIYATYGLTKQTNFQYSFNLPLDLKSTVKVINGTESNSKIKEMSNPSIALEHWVNESDPTPLFVPLTSRSFTSQVQSV